MFRVSAISISKDLVKEAESIFYHFIWNGKDKVKRNAVISEVENGGLNMLDTESMIRTKRVICLQKFLEDYESPWKMCLGELLKPIGGKFLLHCNFEVSKLNITLPAFYRQCLVAWSELNAREPSSVHEIVNQVKWNNKFLCVDKKSVYRRDIADQGFCKIWDLFSVDNVQLNPEQSFFIMSVINSMPAVWRLLIRTANIAPVFSPLPNTPANLINDILIPILDASSKHIYRSFLAKKQTTPTAKEKLSAKYHHLTIDWKRVYLLSFRTTLETKLREFQFKILNRIVVTNEKLFRFGMAESDKCSFCQTEVESIEHLIFSCKISSVFWKHVLSWQRDKNIVVENLKEEDIIFVKFDVGDDFLLVNHILLLGKHYIYSQKCQKGIPSLQGFIAKTRRVYNIELHIARKRSTLNKHLNKREKLIKIM